MQVETTNQQVVQLKFYNKINNNYSIVCNINSVLLFSPWEFFSNTL